MIKLVLFDLDDTLYNESDFVQNGFREVSTYLAKKYNVDYKKLYLRINQLLNIIGRGKIFDAICDEYGFSENINSLVEIYRSSISKLKLYDDSIQVIKKLKSGYKMGIITDGKASVQWNKIKCLELEKFVDKIIVTDDFGKEYWKPNEYSYKEMLTYFNCKPEETLYVGDNPVKDFIGAKNIGILTVRIVRKFGDNMKLKAKSSYEADFTINNLNELINIIQRFQFKNNK